MTTNALDNDAPLPLKGLSDRLNEETYAWLERVEQAKKETDDDAPPSFHLFDDNDDDDEYYPRIHTWTSSTNNPDGLSSSQSNNTEEENVVSVQYILSDASGGHGDEVWAASRHVSNLLVHQCPQLLHKSSLLGLKFLELGAGGGLPSWTAMKCGARVVCTDQPIADRIRCMAESSQRNLLNMQQLLNKDDPRLEYAQQVRVCPYMWGDSKVRSILLEGSDCFDVIVAADCIYNPEFHSVLLDSIQLLLSVNGVALLPFALHGNTDDDNVWGFVGRAKQKGFVMEALESQQLTPQVHSMDPKRGLVHTIRLSLKQSN